MDRPRRRGRDQLSRRHELDLVSGRRTGKIRRAGTNYFRRVVTIPAGRTIKSAQFQYTGDNEGRGWIGQFDLGARNNFHTVKFNDITTRLEAGQTYVFGLTGYHKNAGQAGRRGRPAGN